MGSSKGGSSKGGGQAASAPPTVSQPPVAQTGIQNLSAVESQFVDSPWSEPGWQSNVNSTAQGSQSQYLEAGSTSSQQGESSDKLSQWLFGGAEGE